MSRVFDFLAWVLSSLFLAGTVGWLAGCIFVILGAVYNAALVGGVAVGFVVLVGLLVRGEHG